MMTVHEVAERYGVSTGFLLRALVKIGVEGAQAETGLSTVTLTRFEAEWGEQIRAAKPSPAAPGRGQPKPNVMRVAHSSITGKRDAQGNRIKALLDNPGLIHAIDAAGTRDGDPWSGKIVPGAVHFYDGPSKSGPSAACGMIKVRAVLGDQFVPEDEARAAGQCPRCAEVVAAGNGFRTYGYMGGGGSRTCDAHLSLKVAGRVIVEECYRRDYHSGSHETREGATWTVGEEDYKHGDR